MSFGERLKAARKARGWTQARLGAEARCDMSAIKDYERGAKRPSLATFARLCETLELSPCDLLDLPCSARAKVERLKASLRAAIDAS